MSLRFLPIASQDFFNRLNKLFVVHVWPPAVPGHTNHPQTALVTCMQVIGKCILDCIKNGDLLVRANATTAGTKVTSELTKVGI